MTTPMTYAIVGGGLESFIGPVHRMAIRMDALARLVAGCFSRNAAKNAAAAEELGIARDHLYRDWRGLVAGEKGKIDFLVIATTNETHYEIAKAALEAGMDVFCEKPLSLTAAEAHELGTIAKRRRRLLAVPFTYTGYPMVKLARDLVAQGELGGIDKIVLEYQQGSFRKKDFSKGVDRHNNWKMNPEIAGPSCVVADIGVHAFTLVEYVTGLRTDRLLADLSSFMPGNTLDDDASILLRMKGGAKASIVTSKIATGEENGVRLRVYGSRASLHWNQEDPNTLVVKYPFRPDAVYRRNAPSVAALSPAAARASRFPAGHPEGFVEALASIYDEFCAAVVDRRPHDYPGAVEGERSMRFVDAALRSNRNGNRWERL